MVGSRKDEADRTDVVLHGGDGGIASCFIAASAGGARRRACPLRPDLQLHLC